MRRTEKRKLLDYLSVSCFRNSADSIIWEAEKKKLDILDIAVDIIIHQAGIIIIVAESLKNVISIKEKMITPYILLIK